MRVLVTGADGFVGRHLVRHLAGEGNEVTACHRADGRAPEEWTAIRATGIPLELGDDASVRAAVARPLDAVVHLAAVSSGADARRNPACAWIVNAVGTVRVLRAVSAGRDAPGRAGSDPLVLIVSTGEVYGTGAGDPQPRRESDPVAPVSDYAASKAAAELAALESWRAGALRVVIARAFQHTGPGQSAQFVVPAFVTRLKAARTSGARTVRTGNLEPVRDLLDVRDVVSAYVALLARGEPGAAYNVASGIGVRLGDVFARLAELVGASVVPEPDPALVRAGDIQHLVGDPARLRAATGWMPRFTLDQTLRGVVDAQAD
ncbi:MAG TPA: NAD-dependent epimerase/dehydratase family protein [Gemmatimonadales bacterium]|nr:NAD-dependent epimerase/dehydratase family protein [Gemmatimonadales bacterium]